MGLQAIGLMLVAGIGLADSQTSVPPSRPEFEVASIRPHPADDRRIILGPSPGGRFRGMGVTLKNLMMVAYRVQDFQISGMPNWVSSDRYDILAKTESGSDGTWIECLQSLLEDRFKLKMHRDTREMPVYALVVAKGGPKFKKSDGDCLSPASPASPQTSGKPPETPCGGVTGIWNRMTGTKVTMTRIAETLSRNLGRTVIDKTGLNGVYDVKLEWTPDDSQAWFLPFAPPAQSDTSGPSFYTALQEQLGLKLESQKRPVEVLVVDHAEKASEN